MQVYILTKSSTRLFGGAAKQPGGYSYLHVVEKEKTMATEVRCGHDDQEVHDQIMSKLVVDRFVTLHGADRFTDRTGQPVASLTRRSKVSALHNLVIWAGEGVYFLLIARNFFSDEIQTDLNFR